MVAELDQWRPGPRAATAGLLLLGAAVLIPYLVAGPGLFLDDWYALRSARLDGWWNAAGAEQWRARPGAGVVYAVVFGLIGDRPLIHALIAAVVLLATAIVLERVLRRFLPPLVALAIGATWLVIPNHTSLETWPSALNIGLALLLFVLALERLTIARSSVATDVVAALLLASSVLSYEATGPAGVAAVLVVAALHRDDPARVRRLLVLNGVLLSVVAAWMILNWHAAKSDLDVWIEPVQILNGQIGAGVVGKHVGAPALGALVVIVTVVALYLHLKEDEGTDATPWSTRLMLGGWFVVVVGALPFVRYFYSPVGFGDRVTVVSGLGGAAVIVGVVGWIGVRRPLIGSAVAVAILAGAVGNRISLVRDYAIAADDSRRILESVEKRWPEPPDDMIVFGPYPVMKRNIVAFIDAEWAVEWLYGTREVSAGFTLTEEGFETFPPSQRLDLHELSKLEAVDRLDR